MKRWAAVVIAVTAGLACRLALIAASPDRVWPHSVWYEGDAPVWVRFSESLRAGTPFEFDLPVHTPGMAYLLAALNVLHSGTGFFWLKGAWLALGAAGAGLTVLLARRPFGLGVGMLAGVLQAACFASAVQSTSLNNDVPYTVLLLLIAVASYACAVRWSWANASALGVLHGVAVLFRAEHTLLVALSVAYLLFEWRRGARAIEAERTPGIRHAAIPVVLMSAICFVVPLPWNVRSHRAIERFNTVDPFPPDFGRAAVPWSPEASDFIQSLPAFARDGNFRFITFLAAQARLPVVDRPFVERFFDGMGYVPRPLSAYPFVSSQGPLCFALANNSEADGGFSTRLLGDPPTDLAFGNPRHLRLYQEGFSVGLRFWAEHPLGACRLALRKLDRFAAGLAAGFSPWNWPLGLDGVRWPVDQFAAESRWRVPWTLLLLGLVAIGVSKAYGEPAGRFLLLLLAYKLAVTIAFFGYARQGASVTPFFLTLVSAGIGAVLNRLGRRSTDPGRRAQVLGAGLAGVLLIVCGAWAVGRPTFSVVGGRDDAPRWGDRAFESHQPLRVRCDWRSR